MKEDVYRSWDIAFRFLAALGAAIAFFVAIQQYYRNEEELDRRRAEDDRRTRALEFEKDLALKQMAMLSEIGGAAARVVATVDEETAATDAAREWERRYWAHIVLIRDESLLNAMDVLRRELRYKNEGLVPALSADPYHDLKVAAARVVTTARAVIVRGVGNRLVGGEAK